MNEKHRRRIYRQWQQGAENKSDRGPMNDRDHELHARHIAEQNGIDISELANIVQEGMVNEWQQQ